MSETWELTGIVVAARLTNLIKWQTLLQLMKRLPLSWKCLLVLLQLKRWQPACMPADCWSNEILATMLLAKATGQLQEKSKCCMPILPAGGTILTMPAVSQPS